MPNYKIVDADQLDADMESVADKIRSKSGTSAKLSFPDGFMADIDKIKWEIPDGYIKPTETINITENVSNRDITNGKTLNVNVPTGVFPIGNLSDEVIIRESGNATHKATIPAGYYVANDLILSEWKTGQVTANGTKGAALTVPYSAIGFVPKVGFVILNAGSVSTNAMLCFMTIPAGSRYIYRTSSGVTSAGSLNATFNTNGMSFPAANSSSAYTVNQYRWFALR